MKSNFKFMDMNFVKMCITHVLHYVSGAVRWLDMFVVRYVYKVIDLSWNICSPEQLQQSFTTLASSCNSSAIFMVMTQISFLFYSVSPALASDVPGPGELGRSDGVGVWLLLYSYSIQKRQSLNLAILGPFLINFLPTT